MSNSSKRAFITELFERDHDHEKGDEYETNGINLVLQKYSNNKDVSQKEYLRACKVCGVIPLTTFLRQLGDRNMSLKFQLLPKNAIKSCAIALLRNSRVQSLDLEGCQIQSSGAQYMFDVLQKRTNITEINLRSNKLGTEGLRWIVQLLQSNHHIKSMNLSDNQFEDSDAMFISDILHGDNVLNELNLSHNNFSSEGGMIIGSALGCNDTIKHLNLSWNHLRGKGAQAIGLGLQKNASIKILNVSWNGFDVAGCHGLSHGLQKNSTLVDLDVSSNRVGIVAVTKLLEGMKRNTTLEILRIGNNPLTANGPLFILQSVKRIPNIKYIDFDLQPVDMDFVSHLATYQKTRDLHITYGKVCLKPATGDGDSTMYIKGDPVTVMFEFTRMKEVDILDLFITFDTDGSHSVTWEEFKEGVQVSKIPVRMRDLDTIIKRIDLNLDGEINFSELMIAQKEHNLRVKKLMDKGERIFLNSEIGQVHQELITWFEDKGVVLKNYSFLDNLGDYNQTSSN
uniref:Leucine-rich repeat-containing protein 74B-like n=1 Tax=Crassostrea virginica TaxID=6565 RepID=A0A8B8D2R7_CRAVI|nr:leucine-rich repeat-containing protein 74B-like [Crassostrea virginica]